MTREAFPHDLDAEKAVLGGCLLNPFGFEIATRVLAVDDFYRRGHQLLLRKMHGLHQRGSAIDLLTVKSALTPAELVDAGGPVYLAELLDGVPASTNIEHYARIVKEHADRRALLQSLRKAEALVIEGQTAATVADTAAAALAGFTATHDDVAEPDAVTWPGALEDAAFYGVLGDVVRAVEPHSEADPAALLIQALVLFGNIVGASPHCYAGGARHQVNLFAALVGLSSKGRKGTAYNSIATPFRQVDPTLDDPERVGSGLSSGEGLIWSVRDAILKGREIVDPGVEDKRKLIVEGEFASVLKQLGREGNILSAIIRQAWDSGTLGTMTKTNQAKATGAHISIIGHVTKDELLRYLTATESGNGFGNRILWTCVRRSKFLPEGGELHLVDLSAVVNRLRSAVEFARRAGEVRRGPEARALWADVYPDLSEAPLGMFGAMTSRAEAQVLRLASIYALADCSDVVQVVHLRAALAVWLYCRDSAQFLFGSSIGDPVADEVALALQRAGADGMTRTEIRDYFGRNKNSADLGRALTLLQEHGRAHRQEDRSKPGRPVERWIRASHDKRDLGLVVCRKGGARGPAPASSHDINDITHSESQGRHWLRHTTEVEGFSDGVHVERL